MKRDNGEQEDVHDAVDRHCKRQAPDFFVDDTEQYPEADAEGNAREQAEQHDYAEGNQQRQNQYQKRRPGFRLLLRREVERVQVREEHGENGG